VTQLEASSHADGSGTRPFSRTVPINADPARNVYSRGLGWKCRIRPVSRSLGELVIRAVLIRPVICERGSALKRNERPHSNPALPGRSKLLHVSPENCSHGADSRDFFARRAVVRRAWGWE
jgi:hypothetical protein